jgi:hypothetical protein
LLGSYFLQLPTLIYGRRRVATGNLDFIRREERVSGKFFGKTEENEERDRDIISMIGKRNVLGGARGASRRREGLVRRRDARGWLWRGGRRS